MSSAAACDEGLDVRAHAWVKRAWAVRVSHDSPRGGPSCTRKVGAGGAIVDRRIRRPGAGSTRASDGTRCRGRASADPAHALPGSFGPLDRQTPYMYNCTGRSAI